MIVGTISCKAFLPIIYGALVVNIIVSVMTLCVVSIVLWSFMRNASQSR